MHIFYRISENGYIKTKPNYINNKNCFYNFCKTFKSYINNIIVIADNVSDTTANFLSEYISSDNIVHTSIGNGAGTFNRALDIALNLERDTPIYFVENDYLHKNNADLILLEGLSLGFPFVTLYDHPDKYIDPIHGGNQLCSGGAENTRVYITTSCHWKITNSTTMTFASTKNYLKEYESILRKWTQSSHPHDFQMFLELIKNNAFLISSIPGYSTHGETMWLSPFTDWSLYV